MRSSHSLDGLDTAFDDDRLVADAGLLLPATLAHRIGLRDLVDEHLDLGDKPGHANAGDKLLTLVLSALAGGDCIDDANALRAGGTERVLGFSVLSDVDLSDQIDQPGQVGPERTGRARKHELDRPTSNRQVDAKRLGETGRPCACAIYDKLGPDRSGRRADGRDPTGLHLQPAHVGPALDRDAGGLDALGYLAL
jgi:hypothetical protein